jgi:hypothetical protein
MGPFPILDRLAGNAPRQGRRGEGGGERGPNLAAALRGGARGSFDFAEYAERSPASALAALPEMRVRELEFTRLAGEPAYLASDGDGKTHIIPVRGHPREALDADYAIAMLRKAGGSTIAEIGLMTEYDAYYLDRHHEKPLPVVAVQMNDAAHTRNYFDLKTGRQVGSYSSRNWINRWLYHGLHSLDFPWLYKYRPLWDIVVISLMLGGTAVCVTSLVLTWQVLKRKLSAIVG